MKLFETFKKNSRSIRIAFFILFIANLYNYLDAAYTKLGLGNQGVFFLISTKNVFTTGLFCTGIIIFRKINDKLIILLVVIILFIACIFHNAIIIYQHIINISLSKLKFYHILWNIVLPVLLMPLFLKEYINSQKLKEK